TELVRTLDTFLDEDANVARTAERLFTHRHTIRYRLERVRELTGLDVGSTDGRERLGLGLKAMRVLGMTPPGGPALEAGAGGDRGQEAARAGDDRLEDAAVAERGEQEQCRLEALAGDTDEGDRRERQTAARDQRRRHLRAQVAAKRACLLAHPEDHPSDERGC